MVANLLPEEASSRQDSDERIQQLALFAKVFGLARREYIKPLSPERLVAGALAGVQKAQNESLVSDVKSSNVRMTIVLQHMMSELDAHSKYLTPADYERVQVNKRGEFGGIGLDLRRSCFSRYPEFHVARKIAGRNKRGIGMTIANGLVECIASIEDTPAQRAGVRSGDLISHVDGEPVFGMTLLQAAKKMRGPAGSTIVVSVVRGRARETLEVRITRETIPIRAVRARLEGDIGYIRIIAFNERTYRSMHNAIVELLTKLGSRMSGLIIDLRDNPGGLLDQAVKVSDAFLASGEIVSTIGRDRSVIRRFTADPEDIVSGSPIAVLINGGSASASEIVSGALKDHGRALVLGQRSFGKGSIQTLIPLGNGHGALRLTTARYYTPLGRSIQVHGIEPDVISVEADLARREEDLWNPLSAEGVVPEAGGLLIEEMCPDAGQSEDPVLLCALYMLRGRSSSLAMRPNS
ncbi:MAG: putative CtpA-like serine protease [Alphaproteobacteria bacterium MarineAlpha9_Bin7]|nr:MAG: putative CtpA-like serine protease [Alphaproteobacteria bacterium MarineAlpha9_Bin7]